jgi:hypothetical protein
MRSSPGARAWAGPRAPALVLALVLLAPAAGTVTGGVLRAQVAGGAAPALALPASARELALGGAYAAVVGDEGSVFENPAGMAAIRVAAVGLSWQPYALGAYLANGAAAVRVGRFDVGVGLRLVDFGQDSVLRPGPAAATAPTSAYSSAAVGAATYRFGMFSVGGSATYVKDHVATADSTLYDASGFGFDVGGALTFFDIAALGVVVQDLGPGLATSAGPRAPLPRSVQAGFSLNIVDPQGPTRLMVVGDWISPRGGSDYWAFGLEGGVVVGGVGVEGRVGIATGGAPADRRSAAFGAGLVFDNLRVDWGYQGVSTLGGGSSRFGLRWVP